jgi:hypothetical protein
MSLLDSVGEAWNNWYAEDQLVLRIAASGIALKILIVLLGSTPSVLFHFFPFMHKYKIQPVMTQVVMFLCACIARLRSYFAEILSRTSTTPGPTTGSATPL